MGTLQTFPKSPVGLWLQHAAALANSECWTETQTAMTSHHENEIHQGEVGADAGDAPLDSLCERLIAAAPRLVAALKTSPSIAAAFDSLSPQLARDFAELVRRADDRRLRTFTKEIGLELPDPGAGDRLASLVIGLRGVRLFLGLIASVLFAASATLLAVIERHWGAGSCLKPASHDYGYFLGYYVATPACITIAALYFGRLPRTLMQLTLTNVFELDLAQWQRFRERATQLYSSLWVRLVPFIFAGATTAIMSLMYIFTNVSKWDNHMIDGQRSQAGFIVVAVTFLFYYLVGMTLTRMVATYRVLRALFRHRVNVQILHPDRCGGLSPLGKLSMSLNLGGFFFGLVIVGAVLVNIHVHGKQPTDWTNIGLVLVYAGSMFIVFFMPLIAAHAKMAAAKSEAIQIVNSRHLAITRSLLEDVKGSNTVDQDQLERLESLQKLYDNLSRMPVYPFSPGTVTSFLGTVLAPIGLLMLQTLISKLVTASGF